MAETALSDYQRQVLLDLLRHEKRHEKGKEPWRSMWLRGRTRGLSRSESASRSRAIRRLEERGLVERYNYLTSAWGSEVGRTTDLLLTDEGRALARTLLTEIH